MSERDTLKATLPPDVHDDIERLYEDEADPDPRDVVAALHREGLLDADQLKAAVMALESKNRIRRVAMRPPQEGSGPEILGQLGAGAMGEVLIAKDPGLNRVVAVKRIRPEAARNKSMMRRFYTEAQVTAQLDHPSIVPIHGLVQDEDGGLAYAMKLVRGRTLEDYLDEAAENPDDEEHTLAARLERFLHVCDAMAYAHERGIVHRDLKPENIMVGAFGEVLVMDWGIAKILSLRDDPVQAEGGEGAEEGAAAAPRGTKVGRVMGTPRYMSPEQATGRNDVIDGRADQYSLGLILQEIVTLRPAIPHDMELATCLGWAQSARRNPMKGAPRELVGIVDKACAKEPEDRYPTVAALAEDIRRYLRDEAPLAVPDGAMQRLQRWIGRHRRMALTLIAGSLMLLVVVATSLMAVAGALVGWQQYAAQRRESQLTNVLHRAMDRVSAVDRDLGDVESLTTGLAYAAAASLDKAPPRLPYNVLKAPPPGGFPGGRYGKRIATDYASVGFSTISDKPSLERMAALGGVMSQALVSAMDGDARGMSAEERAQALATSKSGVAWAHVGLREGVYAWAPGTVPPRLNLPRPMKYPWYAAPRGGRGAVWTEPYLDPDGLGQVISCAVPWFDRAGKVAGVAAIDVSVAWLSRRIRAIGDADVYLLDRDGRVMLWTGTDASAEPAFAPLPHAEHAEWITPRKAGWHQASDGTLAVWSPLQTTRWTWVVIAPDDVLRGKAGEAIHTD